MTADCGGNQAKKMVFGAISREKKILALVHTIFG